MMIYAVPGENFADHRPDRLSESPQALWPADGRQERLWGTGILLPQDFCSKTMETITEQPIKKLEFFRCPQSLSWRPPADQKA